MGKKDERPFVKFDLALHSEPTQNLIGMTCPACTIEPSAQYSDCGHEFLPGTKPTDWTPTQISESPGLFTVTLRRCDSAEVITV